MDVKYYFEDNQNRESRLAIQLSNVPFQDTLQRLLGCPYPLLIISTLNKARYGSEGDVDLAVFSHIGMNAHGRPSISEMIAIEIKVSYYGSTGEYRSLKPEKHVGQLERLLTEGWDRVYLLDVVVTEPHTDWDHPQTFEILRTFPERKIVGVPKCGHIVVAKHGVNGRKESDSGSFTPLIIEGAEKLAPGNNHSDLKNSIETFIEGLKIQHYGQVISVYDDSSHSGIIMPPVGGSVTMGPIVFPLSFTNLA